jgi:hypothetical protein
MQTQFTDQELLVKIRQGAVVRLELYSISRAAVTIRERKEKG